MSRVETDTYINDRYAAIEDRLSVSCCMRMSTVQFLWYSSGVLSLACGACRWCARGSIGPSLSQRR